jgi:hypothetical protein
MNKITKTTVYVPVKVEDELIPIGRMASVSFDNGLSFSYEAKGKGWESNEVKYTHWLKPQEGYFFNSEQLNQLLSNVIKDALDTVSEKSLLSIDGILEKSNGQRYVVEEGNHYCETEVDISKESITNTFDITYKKHKV